MYKDNVEKHKIPFLIGNTMVIWHFLVAIYTVVRKKYVIKAK